MRISYSPADDLHVTRFMLGSEKRRKNSKTSKYFYAKTILMWQLKKHSTEHASFQSSGKLFPLLNSRNSYGQNHKRLFNSIYHFYYSMKRKREWTKNSKEKLKGILTKIDFFFCGRQIDGRQSMSKEFSSSIYLHRHLHLSLRF